jgi:hypothetical protein
MRTLLSEKFAPTTSSPGFLRVEFDTAVDALHRWRTDLDGDTVAVEYLTGGLDETLPKLEPLIGGATPRELLISASDGWVAYFDCSLQGTDAVSPIGYLSRTIGCQGLSIATVPHTSGRPGVKNGRLGGVQFELFGPYKTEFLNYVRTIGVVYDDSGKWRFDATGTEQWFEDTAAYRARRVRDRFTSTMLERYCKAMDLDVFNPATYGPRAALIRSPRPTPKGGYVMSLQQVQQWLEITPGMADTLPG